MPALGKILIIDDNEDVLFALHLLLEPYAEKVKVMRSPDRIVHFITDFRPDIVLLDMNFTRDTVSGQEGMDCLQEILKLDRHAVVVMMTAYADTDKAVQAIKAGATDFVSKPWENDKLLATLHAAMKLRRSQTEVGRLEERVEALSAERETPQPLLIGESEGMRNIVSTIGRLREADVNVLLLGENGTGKDVVARYLLAHSSRAAEPFVTIDVGAVPETLFESELFGYEKGAFTDARKEKKGRLELAHGGTLFLDEVGNLSPAAQSKLLTALEKRRIVRLGGTREIPIDVRLICATNADLHAQVTEGTFRQDLFYRITTRWKSTSRPCANAARTSNCWPTISCGRTHGNTKKTSGKSHATQGASCNGMPGRATCANCNMPSNAPSCSATPTPSMPTTSCCTPRHRPWPMARPSTWKHWNATPWRKPSACAKAT